MRWLQAQAIEQNNNAPTGCVTSWPYSRSGAGYPLVTYNGNQTSASNVLLELAGIPRPSAAYEALHSCDNPPCLTLSHLRWGTRADNMKDSADRNRSARGERNGNAIFTEKQVIAIRASTESTRTLAERYGVKTEAVRRIRKGESWGHLL